MQTTNNLFRRVLNCTHSKWWFTQFERKCNILEIFHYFQYFERCRSMKKWQISKPKIVDWYLDFSNESCTTLKSVISSFKICFQNYGQLKSSLSIRHFWGKRGKMEAKKGESWRRETPDTDAFTGAFHLHTAWFETIQSKSHPVTGFTCQKARLK